MAYGDSTQVLGTLNNVLNIVYSNSDPRPQFNRMGAPTSRWFGIRGQAFTGRMFEYRAWIKPSTGVRRNSFASARTGEFPVARDLAYQPLTITTSDLKFYQGTVKFNEIDSMQAQDTGAVVNLVTKVMGDVMVDYASQVNAGIYQRQNCAMATLTQIYDADGSTMTGAAGHAPAFLKINGPISAFQPGDVLDIYDATSTGGSDTFNLQVVVHDVIYGTDGPPSAGVKVADIGPGIIAEPCAADGSVSTGTGYNYAWNTVATPAAGDFIAKSGEFSTSTSAAKGFHGLPDFFDTTVDIFRDEAGSLLDREATGNGWMNPFTYTAAAAGSEVELDADEHFRDVEDYLGNRVVLNRLARQGIDPNGPTINAMSALLRPELLNHLVREAKDDKRITFVGSTTVDAAKSRQVIAESGFDGYVLHSPTLGEIDFQADVACVPYKIFLTDPNSFFWVTFGGLGPRAMEWLTQGQGSKIVRMNGATNQTPTYYLQAAAHTCLCLACDAIQNNVLIEGVKSANQ